MMVATLDAAEAERHRAAARDHKAAGRLEEAAASWLAAGDVLVAAKLFEQLFLPERAIDAYVRANQAVEAVRVAAAAHISNLDELSARAVQEGQGEALRVVLQKARRHVDVGHLEDSRGDHAAAIAAFCAGERFDLAADAAEQLGDWRRAGQLWEQHLQRQGEDGHAHVRLGRLLARFSQHDDAIVSLQRGWSDDDPIRAALAAPTMAMSFVRLGYRHAATAVLERWLRVDPAAIVPTVDELMASGRRLASEATDDMGALLLQGRYLLGQPLGGGGIGQVFRAHDAFSDEPVAVKIFGAEALGSEAVRAYAQDVRAASLLRLPALARVIELNMEQGFIVSELLGEGTRGRSLDAHLQNSTTGDSVTMVMSTVLTTLATCHRANLLHGGLKPQNIFVLDRGAKLVDFGSHRLLALRSTETGGLHTVWPYLSPEALRGEAVTIHTDLYAVAAMMHLAWFGTPPFSSEHQDRRQLPPLLNHGSDDWSLFLKRALAPAQGARWPDAAAMLAAMPPWPAGHPVATPQLPAKATAPSLRLDQERYQCSALVHRNVDHRVEQGQDTVVGRPVWIVASTNLEVLQPLVRCAGQWRGIQPVYDVLPHGQETWVVLARDPNANPTSMAALASWREVPQGLARDLLALAEGLTALHATGVAIGGFDAARALGPVGIRLTLAPAPLPRPHSDDDAAADWASFGRLVRGAFAVDGHDDDDDRIAVGRSLLDQRLVERDVMMPLVDLPWVEMLRGLVAALVANAEPRAVAKVIADALQQVLHPTRV